MKINISLCAEVEPCGVRAEGSHECWGFSVEGIAE